MLRRYQIFPSISSSPFLRFAATRSGPRAFKTDRQRRRILRESSALDNLPLTPAEAQRRSKLAPSTIARGIDAMTSSDALDHEKILRPGRTSQIDQAIETMRDTLAAGPKMSVGAVETTGKLITDAIAKRKNVKTRKTLLMMQQELQQQCQDGGENESQKSNSSLVETDHDEKPWEPSKVINQKESNNKINDQNRFSVATSSSSSLSLTNNSSNKSEIFSPLQTSYSSQIVNDFDSSKLDQIEQSQSNALAKRVDELKPLPVFAGDQESIDAYLGGQGDFASSSLTEETLQQSMKRIRMERMEELSKKFITKYDGDEVAEKARFRKVADEAKEKYKETDMGKHVAVDYRGDEVKELKELASQVDQIHRHNAFVKKRKGQLREEQQQQQKQKQQLQQRRDDHFDRNDHQLESELTAQEELEQRDQLLKNNQEEMKTSSSSTADSNKVEGDTGLGYVRPKSEFFSDAGGDIAILPDRLHYQRENQEAILHPNIRVRRPTSEVAEQKHSFANRHESAVATMAQLMPPRRFEELELFDDKTPVVHQRHEISQVQEEIYTDEKQTFAPVDAYVDRSLEFIIRNGLMKYYARYPINGMITAKRIAIGGIQDDEGQLHQIELSERPVMSLARARRIAAEHGKDLVQVDLVQKKLHPLLGGTGGLALCYITDHVGQALSHIEHSMVPYDGRVIAEQSRPLLEVGFRGVTHDFAIRFKSIYVARFLFKRFPVRITLTKFGTPREGFPIMERVLNFIKNECEKMKAYYISGQIRYDHSSIWVYLHPSTLKLPLTAIEATKPEQLMESMERAIFDAEYDREITIPDSFTARQAQVANRYDKERDEGTAWTWRAEGISINQLRKEKIYQGMLPKGNKKLYMARGDIETLKSPFRTQHQTTCEDIGSPKESNLEQAERAAGVLHRRAEMSVAFTHDKNELPNETHILGDMNYVMTGDVFEIGKFKEAMGIKRNRKKLPRLTPGHATVGQAEDDGVTGNTVNRF